jgi:hypothetical protein
MTSASPHLAPPPSASRRELIAAIDALAAANRAAPDAYREVELRRLRAEAAVAPANGAEAPRWPRDFADPFPPGLPEIAPAALTVDALGGALQHHGALLVRRLFPPAQVAELVECIDRTLAAAQRYRVGADSPDFGAWYLPSLEQQHGLFKEADEWVSVADSPRSMDRLAHAYRDAGCRLIAEYLGERPMMAGDKWTLRRISPDALGDWHQDGHFLGSEVRVVNVWTALTRCGPGTQAIGLPVVPRRLPILETFHDEGHWSFAIPEPTVVQAAGAVGIADPVYEPGDALFFDQMTVHKTGARPGLTLPRYAIESWFFAPSTYPARFGAAFAF